MRLAEKILDTILPPTCLGCREIMMTPAGLCPDCWSKLTFITDPLCNSCGNPFEIDVEGELECGFCIQNPPVFDTHRSCFVYDEGIKRLILPFKHNDFLFPLPLFRKWLNLVTTELVTSETLLMPVPLHWTRQLYRGYNQATLLALELRKSSGAKVITNVLKRQARTSAQKGKSRDQRLQNVNKAFALKNSHLIEDKPILLVDDVFTTGATVGSCAKILKDAGAQRVDVVTLAKVVY